MAKKIEGSSFQDTERSLAAFSSTFGWMAPMGTALVIKVYPIKTHFIFSHCLLCFPTHPQESECSLFGGVFVSFLHTFSTQLTPVTFVSAVVNCVWQLAHRENEEEVPALKSSAPQTECAPQLCLVKPHHFSPVFSAAYYSLQWSERATYLPAKLGP